MVDILAAPQQVKTDGSLRTLDRDLGRALGQPFSICSCCRCCFPSSKAPARRRLYRARLLRLTVFGLVSGLTQAPIGYPRRPISAREKCC